jgi:hypothetical protein
LIFGTLECAQFETTNDIKSDRASQRGAVCQPGWRN